MESYGLSEHRDLLTGAGLTVEPLPQDEHGTCTDELTGPDADAGAVLLTPAHQFPLGVPLHSDRRSAVAEGARRTGGLVLEDDYDGEFLPRARTAPHLDGPAALASALATHAPRVRATGIAAGLHAVLRLPPGTERQVVRAAPARGLAVHGLSRYRHPAEPAAPVAGYGTPPEHAWAGALETLPSVLPWPKGAKQPTEPRAGGYSPAGGQPFRTLARHMSTYQEDTGDTDMAEKRRQLRSGTVVLGGMGLLAAALTACSSDDPDKRCADRDSYNAAKGYKVVSDKNCKSGSSGSRKSRARTTGSDAAWYYGGKESKGWVDGGSFSQKSGTSGSSGSSGGSGVSRGGFGDGDGSSGG